MEVLCRPCQPQGFILMLLSRQAQGCHQAWVVWEDYHLLDWEDCHRLCTRRLLRLLCTHLCTGHEWPVLQCCSDVERRKERKNTYTTTKLVYLYILTELLLSFEFMYLVKKKKLKVRFNITHEHTRS